MFFRFVIKNRDTFFTSAQRSLIVWQILIRTKYGDDESDKVGIKRLLSKGVYKAAYPLHDGIIGEQNPSGEISTRQVGYEDKFANVQKEHRPELIKPKK